MPPTGVLLQQGRRVAKLLLDSMALRFRLDSRGAVEADLISFGTSGGQTFGRYMVARLASQGFREAREGGTELGKLFFR